MAGWSSLCILWPETISVHLQVYYTGPLGHVIYLVENCCSPPPPPFFPFSGLDEWDREQYDNRKKKTKTKGG